MAIEYLTVEHLSTKDLIRIFSKISIEPPISYNGTPCWIWRASLHKKGYGCAWHGKHQKAHRLMFAWLVHPLPVGQQFGEMDHLCRRKSCCNPLHLEFVTSALNAARKPTRLLCLKNLHRLEGNNLILYKNGTRSCRACRIARTKSDWKNLTAEEQAEHYNRVRVWRNDHHEHVLKQAREYAAKPETRQRQRERVVANRDHVNELARQYSARNREKINARQRQWRAEHPDEYKAMNKKHNDLQVQRRQKAR